MFLDCTNKSMTYEMMGLRMIELKSPVQHSYILEGWVVCYSISYLWNDEQKSRG